MGKRNKTTVLVGGCFDVLHPGHIIFLQKAKKIGDKLIVLLESDKKVRLLKGPNRPIHTQKDRAKILSALRCVDQVICLPFMDQHSQYDSLIAKIKPDVIAATKGYGDVSEHKRIAKLVGVSFKYVTNVLGNYSSSRIVNWGLDRAGKF